MSVSRYCKEIFLYSKEAKKDIYLFEALKKEFDKKCADLENKNMKNIEIFNKE